MEGQQQPSVSIVTVTQYSRRECLQILAALIKSQIYTNISEWVIVEGSNNYMEAALNHTHIILLNTTISIKYVPFKPNQHLSDLRNAGNHACCGDIIVCMDDDDYYPPTRVSHAVYMLTQSSALIAGCSPVYVYLYLSRRFFQFKSYGKNHSTNNCLAYKRAYLETHIYDPGLDKAEESSFTCGFTEPMVQLDPKKTIIVSGHSKNTVDKDWVLDNNSIMFLELNEALISDYIPFSILLKMEKIFIQMKNVIKLNDI